MVKGWFGHHICSLQPTWEGRRVTEGGCFWTKQSSLVADSATTWVCLQIDTMVCNNPNTNSQKTHPFKRACSLSHRTSVADPRLARLSEQALGYSLFTLLLCDHADFQVMQLTRSGSCGFQLSLLKPAHRSRSSRKLRVAEHDLRRFFSDTCTVAIKVFFSTSRDLEPRRGSF